MPIRARKIAAPFAKVPTRVAYLTRHGFRYIGEPHETAYRAFTKSASSGFFAVEFDRLGPIRRHGTHQWSVISNASNEHLTTYYHLQRSPYDVAGDFSMFPWSVRRVGGHRCYARVARGVKLPLQQVSERHLWLQANGLREKL